MTLRRLVARLLRRKRQQQENAPAWPTPEEVVMRGATTWTAGQANEEGRI